MNIPQEKRRGYCCVRIIPDLFKDLVEHQAAAQSDKAPNLTIAQWLHTQPEAVRRREGLRVLQKYRLLPS